MMWIIAIICIIINEVQSGELWNLKAARNFGIVVFIALAADKNPGAALVCAIVGISVMAAIELYRCDVSNRKKRKYCSTDVLIQSPIK